MDLTETISRALQDGDRERLLELIEEGLSSGKSSGEILEKGLLAGMSIVGRRFRDGEIFIPEVLIAARAMNSALEVLEPYLVEDGTSERGKLLIGTVKGDLHDIGKNLAGIMFKGAGFQVIDLGVDVPAEKFLSAAREYQPDIIGMSALLTTTMVYMGEVISLLRSEGVKAPIVIGGASVTEKFAREIGADLYARTAMDGVEKSLQILAR